VHCKLYHTTKKCY